VNRIVIKHGGNCWAESEIDKGATFFFSIPMNITTNKNDKTSPYGLGLHTITGL
jgi:signal transduction histidine kinase